MKKTLLIIFLVIVMLVYFIIPVAAWSWKTDGKFEVASYDVPIVEEGTIKVDVELEPEYRNGTKIVSYPDETPYLRNKAKYGSVHDEANANFFAYIAVDTTGMFIYAEIEDTTIFENTNDKGNDGDCLQIYFDWCTEDIVHPEPHVLYYLYELDGIGWNSGSYKSTYTVGGLQYLGWLSADYNGAISAMGGFSPHTGLGPDATDSVVYEAKLIDGGWACEWFIPWRDQEQKDMIYKGEQFHCGIGFQACDDSDIDNVCSPDLEENVAIKFDQRREMGLSYYAYYDMLADVRWGEYPDIIDVWPIHPDPIEGNTSDSMVAVVASLVVAGAGVALFSKKK